VTRAVVFDLWDTIVDFDARGTTAFHHEVARRAGRDPVEFVAAWNEGRAVRDSGSFREYLVSIGIDEHADDVIRLRHEETRRQLVPRPGAVETIAELKRRGLKVGMISVCSDEVPALWPETAFADLFDSTVFSCSVRLRKPDPRIYRLALDELGVEPEEALFVGDGANDELGGAERVGMCAVLIHRPGEEPLWDEVRGWAGPRITSVPEVLDLIGG
jgi:putative hydrolase of the HAD superfamily